MSKLILGPYAVDLYLPEAKSDRVVYLHATPEEGHAVWQLLSGPKPALAVVSGTDWNRDLSPWPAERVFSKGGDFAGGGQAYLDQLTGRIIPAVESELTHIPAIRCIAGYSLAGLFALWSAFACEAFDAVAALSPSLWFDGFTGFISAGRPSGRLKRLVMSLGDREKHTRNTRMAAVETAVFAARDRLSACGVDVRFRFETGGHFDDVHGRVARGISGLYDPGM